jgi:hypothetical protein
MQTSCAAVPSDRLHKLGSAEGQSPSAGGMGASPIFKKSPKRGGLRGLSLDRVRG